MSSNISHKEASERSYVAAAHNENRTEEGRLESLEKAREIHLERTGSELHETLEKKDHGPEQPGLAETDEGRKERAFIAAAHRDGRDEDKKLDSLKKASELHVERTGEPLEEALENGALDADRTSAEGDKANHPLSEAEHLAYHERSLLGAAHRKGRDEEAKNESLAKASEIHKERTGEPLPEAVAKGLDEDVNHLKNEERAFIGAAHRKGRDEDGKNESLLKASEIHEKLTGEPLPEALEKGIVDQDGEAINDNGKRPHGSAADESDKRQRVGLTRQERAFIAAAHRDGRTEEAKLESLRKANEIHEKRTGAPLPEAVERGLAEE